MHPTRPQSESRPKSLCGTNETGPQRATDESLPLTLVMHCVVRGSWLVLMLPFMVLLA